MSTHERFWLVDKPAFKYRLGLTGPTSSKKRVGNFTEAVSGLPQNCKVLEIGVAEGWSADWWLSNAVGEGGSYVGIDPFTDWPKRRVLGADVKKRAEIVLGWHRDNGPQRQIALMEMTSARAMAHLCEMGDMQFDVIYIDGAHDVHSVVVDMMLSWKLLKVGGYWLFDDYGARHGGVKPAYNATIGMFGDCVEEVARNWQVLCKKVKEGFPCA